MDETAGSNTPDTSTSSAAGQHVKRTTLTSRAKLPASASERAYSVKVYTDMLKISQHAGKPANSQLEQIGGKRGIIRGFSRASRKRLIEFIARVRYRGQLLFLTLTYPDMFSPDPAQWERDFDTFRKRFQRKLPSWRGLWRIEQQTRKSGTNKGMVAPHFHVLIFTPYTTLDDHLEDIAEQVQQWALTAWYEIVHSPDPKHATHGAHVRIVRSRKHAYMYVSKYIAKTTVDSDAIGRRWGHIGQFNLDMSSEIIISQEQYIQLRRIIRQWLKAKGRKFHRRFARMDCLQGCTILGLGDGQDETIFNPQAAFVRFLQAAELHSRVTQVDIV